MRSFGRCVGIAAPQLGELVRVIAVDVTEHPKAETSRTACCVLATPASSRPRGPTSRAKAASACPTSTANVRRATRVVVEHIGGTVACRGFEARAVQHELDHLDGILFLDRVESLVDDVFRRRSYAELPRRLGARPEGARRAPA